MSDISYFQIYGRYKDYFTGLDPYDLLFETELKRGFAIGVSRHIPDTEEDIPVGLMIADIDKERIIVKWIYVAPEERGEGIGSRLMELAFEESVSRGFKKLAVRITDEYFTNGLGWNPEDFFSDIGFDNVENELPEWSITALEIYDKKDGYKHPVRHLNIVPLNEMKEKDIDSFYETLKNKYKKNIQYDVETLKALADPMISYVWLQEKELKGYLINIRSGENIYPAAFMAGSQEEELNFLSNAIEVSEDCTKPADTLRVKCHSFGDEDLMKRLCFAAEPIGVKYYTADVNDYLEEKGA